MKRSYNLLLTAAVASLMAACSSTPDRIEDLEVARAVVPQVEASPRAGVAAANISEADALPSLTITTKGPSYVTSELLSDITLVPPLRVFT